MKQKSEPRIQKKKKKTQKSKRIYCCYHSNGMFAINPVAPTYLPTFLP